jgi:hypothetical protein
MGFLAVAIIWSSLDGILYDWLNFIFGKGLLVKKKKDPGQKKILQKN